jgi:polyisoprenyl-phosphate glycosyltransferase
MFERAGQTKLSLLIPLFNEEAVLARTHQRLSKAFESQVDVQCEFIFIDDGSSDRTFEIASDLLNRDDRIRIIRLSRNFGHQAALSAGLKFATGHVVAIIDGDLQDPPEIIPQMLDLWRQGNDVVYGVRQDRKENIAKRVAYSSFYRVWKKIASIEIPLDSGDFCLMDRQIVDEINQLPEINRFVRGLRSWVGYKQIAFPYERAPRAGGYSKYSITDLFNLAWDGILDFSTAPLRLISWGGIFTSIFSLTGISLIVLQRLFQFSLFGMTPADVPGWTSIIFLFLLLGGMQLFGLGIVGMYIGRIYEEVKRRPGYVVKSTHGFLQDTPANG